MVLSRGIQERIDKLGEENARLQVALRTEWTKSQRLRQFEQQLERANTRITDLEAQNDALTNENANLKKENARLQQHGGRHPTSTRGAAQTPATGRLPAAPQANTPSPNVAYDTDTEKKVMKRWQDEFNSRNDKRAVILEMAAESRSRDRRESELGVRHRLVPKDEQAREYALEANVQAWIDQALECIANESPVTLRLTR